MKKKIICLALVFCLVLGLSACSTSKTNANIDYDIDKSVLSIPEEYKLPIANAGQTIAFNYSTSDSAKQAVIYIPYGYSKENQYNIVYALGGSSGNEKYYFGEAGSDSEFKNIIDNMINNGDINPLIFVSDDFIFSEDETITQEEMDARIDTYCNDVREYLIPAVESEFSTYAQSVTPDGIEKSREHRAFTGFSQGAAITWNMLAKNNDCFYYYMPLSGSGTDNACKGYETDLIPIIKKGLKKSGYTNDDISIFAYVGTKDYTISKMYNFIDKLDDKCKLIKKGDNLSFKALDGGTHEYKSVKIYAYNYLLEIFK